MFGLNRKKAQKGRNENKIVFDCKLAMIIFSYKNIIHLLLCNLKN